MSIGIWQVVLVLAIVLILFGAGKLPKVMGDVAKGVKNFKAGMKDDDEDDKKVLTSDAPEPEVADARLKRDDTTGHVPVIVTSQLPDAEKGFALGADAYGVKPIERAWLIETLDRLVPCAPAADVPCRPPPAGLHARALGRAPALRAWRNWQTRRI